MGENRDIVAEDKLKLGLNALGLMFMLHLDYTTGL